MGSADGEVRMWFSVARTKGETTEKQPLLFLVSGERVEMVESERVLGSAPIGEITSVTVHETFSPAYEARVEVTTRVATLVLWRDAAATAKDDRRSESAVLEFLGALGCPVCGEVGKTARLCLGSRVMTYKTHQDDCEAEQPEVGEHERTARSKATEDEGVLGDDEGEEENGVPRAGKAGATLSSSSSTTRAKSIPSDASTATEEVAETERRRREAEERRAAQAEEDAAYERLKLRAELRWGEDKRVPRSVRRSRRSSSDDEKHRRRSVYRGSWLATVDKPSSEAAGAPTVSPGSTASLKKGVSFDADEPTSVERRERYRDTLAVATESAARKAADVSRAALSVHADAERLGAQLTTDASTAELESTLSLAADGAKEARARLAALEKEVAMLAGPTLRDLAWATQLRRTADSRLARDLAAEWPKKGWVVVRNAPSWGDSSGEWKTRLFLEMRGTLLVARASDARDAAVAFEYDLAANAVELRRCREPGAPAFALELVPIQSQWASYYLLSVATYFFDAFKQRGFAFAPESADEQRCWSVTVNAVLREASVARAIAAGETRDEPEDAPAAAEPARDVSDEPPPPPPSDDDDDDDDDSEEGVEASQQQQQQQQRVLPRQRTLDADADDEATTTTLAEDSASVRSLDDQPSARSVGSLDGPSKLEAFKREFAEHEARRSLEETAQPPERDKPASRRREVEAFKRAFAEHERTAQAAAAAAAAAATATDREKKRRRDLESFKRDFAEREARRALDAADASGAVTELALLEREHAARREASSILESQSLEPILHEKHKKPPRRTRAATAALREYRERLARSTARARPNSVPLDVHHDKPRARRPSDHEVAVKSPAATPGDRRTRRSNTTSTPPAGRPGGRRVRESARPAPAVVVVRKRGAIDLPPAAEMVRELERGAIVTIRFIPGTKTEPEKYEFECIDAFEFVDDETLAPLLKSLDRPTLAKLYSAWRSEFSIKTDQHEFRHRLKAFMAAQARRWLASCTLLQIERPRDACVVLLRIHDDPAEYVQPIKFGDVVINWAPNRDEGKMTFADRATSNAVVVANLTKWLDTNRVTAQRTLRIDTASSDQSEDATLNYPRVYRKLFQKAVIR